MLVSALQSATPLADADADGLAAALRWLDDAIAEPGLAGCSPGERKGGEGGEEGRVGRLNERAGRGGEERVRERRGGGRAGLGGSGGEGQCRVGPHGEEWS